MAVTYIFESPCILWFYILEQIIKYNYNIYYLYTKNIVFVS